MGQLTAFGLLASAATALALVLPHDNITTSPPSPDPISTAYYAAGYLPPPTYDPWYSPPSGWESTVPGTPLRIRQPAYPSINVRGCKDTLQILYRSSDTHGNASWSVVTVFRPNDTYFNSLPPLNTKNFAGRLKGRGVVSYQVPSDSVAPDAAPSNLLQGQEPYGEMRDLLMRGWIVAVPDYEGPRASYCAGAQAGYATLDAIRAVRAVAGTHVGIDPESSRYALWGYSGGGFAAGFAMELMGRYAPDLIGKLVGAAVGGPSPNLTTVAQAMNKKDTAGLVVASLVGVVDQWPEAREYLRSRLKAEGTYNATGFLKIEKMSGVEALMAYKDQDVYDYFVGGKSDIWGSESNGIIQAVVDKDAVMGVHEAPPKEVPVFVYKAAKDEMSAVEETDVLVESYCKGGARVLYHRNHEGGHNDELWAGRLRTMDFLRTVLDGWTGANMTIPDVGKCITEDVKVPLDVTCLLPEWWWGGAPRPAECG
ncbi:lipase 2 [Rhypophila decipiens]|uniref:Lipase 2 n=1 Tax=Rhypophila decipiens TaxID=261697 RepID=A0AAN7B9X3_9PEZI|nr:lipase 2 [Rhypophila decipiens]